MSGTSGFLLGVLAVGVIWFVWRVQINYRKINAIERIIDLGSTAFNDELKPFIQEHQKEFPLNGQWESFIEYFGFRLSFNCFQIGAQQARLRIPGAFPWRAFEEKRGDEIFKVSQINDELLKKHAHNSQYAAKMTIDSPINAYIKALAVGNSTAMVDTGEELASSFLCILSPIKVGWLEGVSPEWKTVEEPTMQDLNYIFLKAVSSCCLTLANAIDTGPLLKI
jgi:hypothetical protein